MKAFVNQHLFTQTTVDSGSLTMLGVIVRNFPEPGEYTGTILRGSQSTGRFHLTVDEDCPAMQVNVDLSEKDQTTSQRPDCDVGKHYVVNPKGYVVFRVARGAGRYAATVGRLGREGEEVLFDSRELKAGDLFAVTLIRPGTYRVTEVNTGASGKIVVAYPRIGKEAYRPPDPITVEYTENGFDPDTITLEPARGQVYQIKTQTPARIKIELEKPDDGPRDLRPPKIRRWRRQRTAKE